MAFTDTPFHLTLEAADLYVERVGPEDGPPVYYLHGGPGYNSYSFRDLMGDSLEQYLMIYADQRGGGRSYADRPFGLADLADDVRAVLEALNLDKVTLLAHGFGAAVATRFAATHPEMVDRLVLVGPWFSMPALAREVQRTAARLAGNPNLALPAEADIPEGEGGPPADLVNEAFSMVAAKKIFDALEFPNASARLRLEHSDSDALSGSLETPTVSDPWDIDVTPLLDRLKAPVVILAGQSDRTSVPGQVEAGLAALPHALLSLFEGGHYPWLDDPEAFTEVLEQALSGPLAT